MNLEQIEVVGKSMFLHTIVYPEHIEPKVRILADVSLPMPYQAEGPIRREIRVDFDGNAETGEYTYTVRDFMEKQLMGEKKYGHSEVTNDLIPSKVVTLATKNQVS